MTSVSEDELIACHECDHLYRHESIDAGAKANCHYCGALLYNHIPNTLDRSLALYLTALILFIIANTFPFLSLKIGGRIEENMLISSAWALYEMGMAELGLLVFFTSIGFPFIVIAGMLYLLIPLRFGQVPPAIGTVYRIIHTINPWNLIGVFMLGVLIAFVKLQDIATVIPGTAVFALAGLLIAYSAARANFDPRAMWQAVSLSRTGQSQDIISTDKTHLLNCHTCGLVSLEKPGHNYCSRCDTALHFRKKDSINRTWALCASATILLIPANVYPVMTVIRFGQGEPSTIISGILHLIEDGMLGLAMIIFVASIVVPVLKLIILSFLLLSVHYKSSWRPGDRTLLYRITEVVGAWSMVDIFLVGLLSALVSLDALSTISPGIGAMFFAGVVVITMIAAHSFDPRLIWDNANESED